MTDPRFTDPRYSDPRLSDPVLRRDESAGGMWGWIAGVAVILLIGFLIIAGANNKNTAQNGSPAATTSSMNRSVPAPSTTGSGSTSPKPVAPAPATPAPSPPKSNAQ